MPKLTKRFVNALKPVEKETVFWDDTLPGFGLRARPSGRKTFIIQYRNSDGRTRKVTLGVYGRLTPDEARHEAKLMLAEVDKGNDPAELRDWNRAAPTVSDLAERYINEHAVPKKKSSSVAKDRQLLKRFVLPALGKRKVHAVTRKDLHAFHHALRETPIQANRCLALASKMFNLAEKWGLRPDATNPCRHVERFKENRRERFLSGDELARLGRALAAFEKEGAELPSAILAIRLLIFTGARRGEILDLKWDYVDYELECIRLPDSKTGAKVIPLNGPALSLLKEAPRILGNPYVCPGNKPGGPLVGLHRIWDRIRRRAGITDLRIHDLRHSFASIGAAAGLGLPIIGALLGHTQAQTTKRYAHLAMDPLRAATEEVGRRIQETMNLSPEKKVIALRPNELQAEEE